MHFSLPSPILLLFLPLIVHASDPSYCTGSTTVRAAHDFIPATTSSSASPFNTWVIPPLPCNSYAVQEGICCTGSGFACANNNCTCTDGTMLWAMPLADCVKHNPDWSGCPGNNQLDLCCSGPGIVLTSSGNDLEHAVCDGEGNTAVWTVVTKDDGSSSTSSVAPGFTDGVGGMATGQAIRTEDGSTTAIATGTRTTAASATTVTSLGSADRGRTQSLRPLEGFISVVVMCWLL